jgi:hypothetical protein
MSAKRERLTACALQFASTMLIDRAALWPPQPQPRSFVYTQERDKAPIERQTELVLEQLLTVKPVRTSAASIGT